MRPPARLSRRWRVALLICTALAPAATADGLAANPQPYTVKLAPTGNAALDAALKDSSSLISLRKTGPAGPFALVTRAQQDAGRFTTALQSFGYYDGKPEIDIAGHNLDDPTLPDFLDRVPAGHSVAVDVHFALGPLFHLRHVAIQGEVPSDVRAKLPPVVPGAPAVASEVLAAQQRLLDQLRNDGHALAKVDTPIAIEIPAQHALDVTYQVDAGPRVDLGPVTVQGLKGVNAGFIQRRLTLHQGEQFSPAAIEAARQDLISTGVFSTVRVNTPDRLDPEGQLPLTFVVVEQPRHVVGLNAAYSTDLGFSAGATWSDRNLFGNAEQLNLHAKATQLGGTATTGAGYDIGAQFIKPDFLARDQALQVDLGGLKEDLEAYSRTAVLGDVLLKRKLSKYWSGSIGISAIRESVLQEGVTRDYTLLGLPITLKYDDTNSLLEPTRGIRGAVSVTPTESLSTPNATFVVMQASGSTYFSLDSKGHSVLALRGLVGSVQGASTFQLPPDQRFYAGGSATLRGYKYQSVSPLFPDNNPIGGTAIDAGTIEFRQRVWHNIGAVAFVDAAQVSDTAAPFTGTPRVGVGVGARYYLPIGPIRLDVAFPLNREPGGDSFELYIGLGEAF